MGNTTIIELNHDFFMDIEKDKVGFADKILAHLGHGNWNEMPKRIPGGQIVCSFHRSPGHHHDQWYKFKDKLEKIK